MDIKSKQRTDNGKKKIIVFAIIIFVVGILISGGFYLYNSNQQDKLILEKQLKEQNAKINEQERIEAERIAEEERKQKAERLSALKSELDNTITKLRSENIALDKIKEFQFGRLSSERDAQIKSQLEKIRSLENKVESLKNAIEKY